MCGRRLLAGEGRHIIAIGRLCWARWDSQGMRAVSLQKVYVYQIAGTSSMQISFTSTMFSIG